MLLDIHLHLPKSLGSLFKEQRKGLKATRKQEESGIAGVAIFALGVAFVGVGIAIESLKNLDRAANAARDAAKSALDAATVSRKGPLS